MNTFEITALYMGEEFTVTIDELVNTESSILKELKERKKERFETESGEDANAKLEETFEVSDWGDVPEWVSDYKTVQSFKILSEVMPEYYKSSYDIEVFEAAHQCGIQFSDVDEVYSGHHSDNEAFAQDLADQLGAVDRKAAWPMNCIDWEQAAKELMDDYCEHNGHYFRKL